MANFNLEPEFKKLAETDCLILGNIFEETFLLNKISGIPVHLDSFYGDPCFGLIDVKSNWCIVGGDHIVIWYADRPLIQIDTNTIECVVAARQVSQYDVELIAEAADGWFDKKRLNVNTLIVEHLATIHKPDYYVGELQEWVW